MKEKICVQEAMLVLQNHYAGKSESGCRKQEFKDYLKRLFYSNKTTFYFQKYVGRAEQTFKVLDNYNVPLYEEDKFRQLLNNIHF